MHLLGSKNPKSFELEDFIINFCQKNNLTYEIRPKKKDQRADLYLKTNKGTFVIEVKGYSPFLSDISEIVNLANAYKEEEEEVIPMIIYAEEKVPEDVLEFANNKNVILCAVKDINKMTDTIKKCLIETEE
ncbi:MAG: hypothetical protein ACTSR3_11090 [Candidatus Helarchaeota archaeon]